MTPILIGIGLGAVAGLVFFHGLAWTVARLPSARAPALLALASLLVRLVAVALALLVAVRGGIAGAVAFLLGLLVSRRLVVGRVSGPPPREV